MEIKDWDHAKLWAETANTDKEETEEPIWSWDCNFKLDYDGPVIQISSRFYPPIGHYGDGWDGTVSVYFGSEEVSTKDFKFDSIEVLKIEVEKYVSEIRKKIYESVRLILK